MYKMNAQITNFSPLHNYMMTGHRPNASKASCSVRMNPFVNLSHDLIGSNKKRETIFGKFFYATFLKIFI